MNNPSLGEGKVSIVIPYYNQGRMLLETLASIEQVRSDTIAEVIVVDDGSTDGATCRIIEGLDTSKYGVIRQSNQGLSSARNAGIEIAKGDFILPIDSDDLIRGTYFDSGVAVLLENPDVGVVYGDAEYFGERTGRCRVREFDIRTLVKMNYIWSCALFRKSVWDSVGGYDEKMLLGYEDWDFWLRASLRGWRFFHVDEVAFDYRVRHGSMITDTRRRAEEIIEYVFAKPGYDLLKTLKDQGEALSQIVRSRDYIVGHAIVSPLRKIKRALSSSPIV